MDETSSRVLAHRLSLYTILSRNVHHVYITYSKRKPLTQNPKPKTRKHTHTPQTPHPKRYTPQVRLERVLVDNGFRSSTPGSTPQIFNPNPNPYPYPKPPHPKPCTTQSQVRLELVLEDDGGTLNGGRDASNPQPSTLNPN
jgi:hypothetical protein